MLPDFYQFQLPTKVLYGAGLALDFAHELQELSATKYFIVSDHIISEIGLVDRIETALKKDRIDVTGRYIDVPQDASVACVEAIAKMASETGAEGLIAIGGGSVIDAAKAANFIFSNGGNLVQDYSGASTLLNPLKPFVVVPTTAGTGSEVTLAAVIYDEESKTKLSFSDKYLLPDLAVLDPEMTISMPPLLTAATGMDAFTHAIEAYVGVDASPHSQSLSLAAIDYIYKYLVRATENGDNIEARGAMLIGANLAGIAFSHSMVGCVHSMAHAVGSIARVPHGIANSILLPYGMEYNFEESKEKFAQLAPLLGENVTDLSINAAARAAIDGVRKLTQKLNEICKLPLRLRDTSVTKEMLPKIALKAEEDGTSIYNPRAVVADEIIVAITSAY